VKRKDGDERRSLEGRSGRSTTRVKKKTKKGSIMKEENGEKKNRLLSIVNPGFPRKKEKGKSEGRRLINGR